MILAAMPGLTCVTRGAAFPPRQVSGDPTLCSKCWCGIDAYAAASGGPFIDVIRNPAHPSWAACMAQLSVAIGLRDRDLAIMTETFCVNGFIASQCPSGSSGARAKTTTPKVSSAARTRAAAKAKAAPAAKKGPAPKGAPAAKTVALPAAGH
jgi:hypothetical protein